MFLSLYKRQTKLSCIAACLAKPFCLLFLVYLLPLKQQPVSMWCVFLKKKQKKKKRERETRITDSNEVYLSPLFPHTQR